MENKGPLHGIRIIEMAGLGPAPLAAQLLADLGADVITVDRKSGPVDPTDVSRRNKRSVALNLKDPDGTRACRRLIDGADVLIEGFRPGVMERLGLGPQSCFETNPRLVYGRMTGWGQEGPWAKAAGHDINYISLSGALNAVGHKDRPPVPPLNFFGDYGGGSMFLIFGVLAALLEREKSGQGQVVDAAMVDGVSAMMSMFYTMRARGAWSSEREANMLDGGAHFYRCYETKDGKAVSVGAIEPQFYAELCEKAGLPHDPPEVQYDKGAWPGLTEKFAEIFRQKTRDEWAAIFAGSDACVAPVLTIEESERHPHLSARDVVFRGEGEVLQAAPAPRFARTPAGAVRSPCAQGGDSADVLAEAGYSDAEIAEMTTRGVIT
ncbi:CaiB/BaiF CoA transferase family protein [Amorphus sp. 3PC139-8]|uniref:CaiB/BaiF CoA transferase family protein n=1 Tax=Amorphus sp. 3PC139-8 TaxID=2735676 RepID=UPI00345DCF76